VTGPKGRSFALGRRPGLNQRQPRERSERALAGSHRRSLQAAQPPRRNPACPAQPWRSRVAPTTGFCPRRDPLERHLPRDRQPYANGCVQAKPRDAVLQRCPAPPDRHIGGGCGPGIAGRCRPAARRRDPVGCLAGGRPGSGGRRDVARPEAVAPPAAALRPRHRARRGRHRRKHPGDRGPGNRLRRRGRHRLLGVLHVPGRLRHVERAAPVPCERGAPPRAVLPAPPGVPRSTAPPRRQPSSQPTSSTLWIGRGRTAPQPRRPRRSSSTRGTSTTRAAGSALPSDPTERRPTRRAWMPCRRRWNGEAPPRSPVSLEFRKTDLTCRLL